jgi:hypothetical protein
LLKILKNQNPRKHIVRASSFVLRPPNSPALIWIYRGKYRPRHFNDTGDRYGWLTVGCRRPHTSSDQTLRIPVVLLLLLRSVRQNPGCRAQRCCCSATARFVFLWLRCGAVVSLDISAVSVRTVRLGVLFWRPTAASPPQELEVRAAGGHANF